MPRPVGTDRQVRLIGSLYDILKVPTSCYIQVRSTCSICFLSPESLLTVPALPHGDLVSRFCR